MLNIKGGRTAGKVAHWLIILAALAKEWGSVPSTYMATHKNSWLFLFQGIWTTLDSCIHMLLQCTCVHSVTHIHIKLNKHILKGKLRSYSGYAHSLR